MKKARIFFSIIIIMLLLSFVMNSCKEVGPVVPWGNNGTFVDTTYIESDVQSPQPKNALIEEITGVSCPNCPAAHVILDNLISTTNNRVIGVSYHVGPGIFNQDGPPPGTTQNMTSTDAQSVVSYLVFPDYGPSGAVDRIVHTNVGPFAATSVWDIPANWGGYVNTELAETAPVNIILGSAYTAASKQITINVSLHYTAPRLTLISSAYF
jgi:hypothetical protein